MTNHEQTVTDLTTQLATKTYSTVSVITTTIYNTKVESSVGSSTRCVTSPYT